MHLDKGPKIDLNDDDSEDEDDSSEEEDRSKSKVIFNFKPYIFQGFLIDPIELSIIIYISYIILQISLDLLQQAKVRRNLTRTDANHQLDQLDRLYLTRRKKM